MENTNLQEGQRITACYSASTYRPNKGAFRSATCEAELEILPGGKMARVIKAAFEPATSKASWFSTSGNAAKQIGARKRLSSLWDIKVMEATE